MNIRIEWVMVGGPQHGRTLILRQDASRRCRPAIVALDGQLGQCAVRRNSHRDSTRCMLMHPQANAAQLLEMLAAFGSGDRGPSTRHSRNPASRTQSNCSHSLLRESSR
jgi:hypothetical protein